MIAENETKKNEIEKKDELAVLEEMFVQFEEVQVGEVKVKVRPATLSTISGITEKLSKISAMNLDSGVVSMEAVDIIVDVIHDGVYPYHPNYTKKFIKDNFSLLVFPDFVEAITQTKRFFAKMRKIEEGLPLDTKQN